MFISSLFTRPEYYITWIVITAFSICVHEFCHAYIAHLCGDDTAYRNGFMCLNPLKVMGWMALIWLLVCGISWGAVPVCDFWMDKKKRSAISAAGPLANLGLAIICALLVRIIMLLPILISLPFASYIIMMLSIGVSANCLLFVFNILPVPLLDGWGILEPFFKSMEEIPPQKKYMIFNIFIFLTWCTKASCLISIAAGILTGLLI